MEHFQWISNSTIGFPNGSFEVLCSPVLWKHTFQMWWCDVIHICISVLIIFISQPLKPVDPGPCPLKLFGSFVSCEASEFILRLEKPASYPKFRKIYLYYIYSGICPGGIFLPSRCHFFSTLMADYEHFLHCDTCFNWLPWSIMSAGLGKTKFWTRHLR